ncbi:MAG: hypothetical protein WD030_09965 [Pirellulales bacterium]
MSLDPQTIAALAIATAATVYLGRRSWNLFAKQTGGCGSCASGCGSSQSEELVQLQNGPRDSSRCE